MKTRKFIIKPVTLFVAISFAGSASAVGTGKIVTGSGNITKGGSNTIVQQTSDKMIVNWDNMNIAKSETLQFKQPNANSSVLNKISSIDPTIIQGALNSNGKVFIVNPNGVLISKGAAINVGSLVASSLDIKNDDFNNKQSYQFTGNGKGKVINQGTIISKGSTTLLGANEVANQGSITSKEGNVNLVSAGNITLLFPGSDRMTVQVNQGSLTALINSGGLIVTKDGSIALTAFATDKLTRSVINSSGMMEASGIVYTNSGVYLNSQGNGNINVSGNANAKSVQIASRGDLKQDRGAKISSTDLVSYSGNNVELNGETTSNYLTLTANKLVQGTDSSLYASETSLSGGEFDLSAGNNYLDIISATSGSLNLSADSDTNIAGGSKFNKLKITSDHNVNIAGNGRRTYVYGDVDIVTKSDVSLSGELNTKGNVAISGDNITGYSGSSGIHSDKNVILNAKNDIVLTNIKSNNINNASPVNMNLNMAAKNINVGSINMTGTLNASTTGNFSSQESIANTINILSGDTVELGKVFSSGNIKVSAVKNIETSGAQTQIYAFGGDIDLSADNVNLAGYSMTAKNINISADNIKAYGIVEAKKLLSATANNMTFEDIFAGDINLTAKNNVSVDSLVAKNAVISALDKIALGNVSLSNNLKASTQGDFLFSSDISANDISVNANNIIGRGVKENEWQKELPKRSMYGSGNITLTANNAIDMNNISRDGSQTRPTSVTLTGGMLNVAEINAKTINLNTTKNESTTGNIILSRLNGDNGTIKSGADVKISNGLNMSNDLSIEAEKGNIFLPRVVDVKGNLSLTTQGNIEMLKDSQSSGSSQGEWIPNGTGGSTWGPIGPRMTVGKDLSYTLSQSSKLIGFPERVNVAGKTTTIIK